MFSRVLSKVNRALKYTTARRVLRATELAIFSRYQIGRDVLHSDWDLLIILDTCRIDALASFSGRYPWLRETNFSKITSRGGSTLEWTAQTFCQKNRNRAAEVTYLAGNPLVEEVLTGRETPEERAGVEATPTKWNILTPDDLNQFIPVYQKRREDGTTYFNDRPHPGPEIITNETIRVGRENDASRVVAHYMQPHSPYLARASESEELLEYELHPFPYLKEGGDREKVWHAYINELDSALSEVNVLLENFEADRVVITSDHGEAFGEYRGYGHRAGSINPYIRRVPWVVTEAVDRNSRVPDFDDIIEVEQTRDDILEALGYL